MVLDWKRFAKCSVSSVGVYSLSYEVVLILLVGLPSRESYIVCFVVEDNYSTFVSFLKTLLTDYLVVLLLGCRFSLAGDTGLDPLF
jgi:hypothetical protein